MSSSQKKETDLLTPDQFEKFIISIPQITVIEHNRKIHKADWPISSKEFQMLFKMTYYCALGISETLKLHKSDIDLTRKIVSIRKSVGVHEETSIPPIFIDELEEYLKSHEKKLFQTTRGSAWNYAIAAAKIAGLNLREERKVKDVRKISLLIFKKSWGRRMQKDDASDKLIAIKLRKKSQLSDKWPIYDIKELIDWEEKKYPSKKKGLVILLDALGIKGIWKGNSPTDVQHDWNTVITNCRSMVKELTTIGLSTTFNAFSDTVVITASGSDIKILITKMAETLIKTMEVAIAHDIFFRGCISIGEFFPDPNIIVGKAIDDAAQYYQMPEWIGISVTPNSHKLIDSIGFHTEKNKGLFVEYDIPLKNTIEKKGMALNWPTHVINIGKLAGESENSHSQTLRELVETKIENSDDINVSFKWRNTLNFIDYVTIN
ncbi:MAG: hypothetical protein KGI27_04700 [Thaumarchaeota archaeon]|nr:hypothetical protein [Nitrososphaerota archaeon]